MILRSIEFNEEEEPKTITVNMSVEEAAWIASLTGSINNRNSQLHSDIYDCLVGAFFNKFFDDGIAEAAKEKCIRLPKIEDINLTTEQGDSNE